MIASLSIPNSDDDVITLPATCGVPACPPFTNSSPHCVRIWNITFPTAEHAFQYRKHVLFHPDLAELILKTPDPIKAKELAWSASINQKWWNAVRQSIMFEIICAKRDQHRSIKKALELTGDKAIIQLAHNGDTFWGIGEDGNGRNTMGKLWMMVREMSAS